MTVKLAVLKTGEYVISDVMQASEDGKLLCFVLNDPKTIVSTQQYEKMESDEVKLSVVLITWPQFTKTTSVEVYPDAFTCFVDPSDDLKKLYEDSLK